MLSRVEFYTWSGPDMITMTKVKYFRPKIGMIFSDAANARFILL